MQTTQSSLLFLCKTSLLEMDSALLNAVKSLYMTSSQILLN
ncbi:hypothetical protein EV11_0864 [Prochlorococcus sp. SS52]|nr:hypothetical protein EV04_0631 [Prochlorococcus marinus str. LG]KGG21360.1 hypothetical protein EV08_0768 [Prochlorococcus marinus str. SS2]KGG24308.1 hypothetical protein EV09_0355 [Prochlorococcus marinus str. SS35]KGG33592.1 hypothetical protein EV10_0432 [Prochlorococcus marinus str. SS51]KGG36492.1 hypothetical protein EV11_0864 [Prochlorococcus sp. SS52]